MISFLRSARILLTSTHLQSRNISSTSSLLVKEIQSKHENGFQVLQGVQTDLDHSEKMLSATCQPKFCPECTLGLNIKHTNVLILSQYVRSDGCMLPRRITGLYRRQQKRMGILVTMEQKAGLMPNLNRAWSKKDKKTLRLEKIQ